MISRQRADKNKRVRIGHGKERLEMKRLLATLLALMLALSLAACGGDTSDKANQSDADGSSAEQQADPAGEKTEEPAEAEEPETPANAADLGDYHVEITGVSLSTDYEGNPAVIVSYSWTNNSEDTTMPMTTVTCSVFQDGVGAEAAIMMDENYDGDSSMTEVRPGTTLDVQEAFVLSNTTSPIEVEISEWLTLDDDPPVAYQEFDLTALS